MNKQEVRGYLFSILATLAMSNVYIFSKDSLSMVSFSQFMFYWFAFAIFWNLAYALPTGKQKKLRDLNRKNMRILALIGLLEVCGTFLFFAAIRAMENPSVVSFLENFTPLFVTIFGVWFLRDRFNLVEILGIILTFAGTLIISSGNIHSVRDFFSSGSGLVLFACLFFSTSLILAKRSIHDLDPGILALNRTLFIFVASLAVMILQGTGFSVPRRALLLMAIGALLGPFLTVYSQYAAIRYIESSRSAIIQSLKGLFVLAGAYVYFGTFPDTYQVAGGLLSITGVIFITLGKSINRGWGRMVERMKTG